MLAERTQACKGTACDGLFLFTSLRPQNTDQDEGNHENKMAFEAGIPFKYGMSVEAKVNELWLLAPPNRTAVSLSDQAASRYG